ncbi:uncharacterized protein LOC121978711 [Zingiber officinale]|uniref:uncharacterized protein LOC121978711 n=1 Tax=Zingiber officinale TaxID=94328 RepID=UPI001C4C1A85|nr:uncharacterized protein LOC121978711 [Zingiber officinale]
MHNWRKAMEVFNTHVDGVASAHNDARTQLEAFQNQRQSLPFRGHDESLSSSNKGNFLELIEWYTQRNDEVAKTMNENALGNNQMKYPTVQKDLTRACAAEVTNFILNDIKDNIFSLMVDECRDISVKEQMGVVLRYVNKHGCVIEKFLAIVHVSDTSAISLKKAIDELFVKHKLSLSRLRGQGYDGASNMRGEYNGLKALILKENSSASASCKRKDKFRQLEHDKLVECLEKGDIVSVLENVYDDNTNDDNNGITASLIDKMESYEFVFVMHLMKSLLGITNELSLALQQKDQNIVLAISLIKTMKVLDMMVQEMNNQFLEPSTEVFTCIACLYPKDSFSQFNIGKLLRLAKLYPEDFSLTDRVILEDKLETYIQNVRGEFSMIILKIWEVLLKRWLKRTDLRNRMGDEWMNDSLVVYIEKDIFATIENEQILQHFQQMNTRRIQLPPLLIIQDLQGKLHVDLFGGVVEQWYFSFRSILDKRVL